MHVAVTMHKYILYGHTNNDDVVKIISAKEEEGEEEDIKWPKVKMHRTSKYVNASEFRSLGK